jgi:tripartite-type tricarboxylate transporter receptor subunit TctC
MKLPRRKFLHLAAGAGALPTTSRLARARAYPTRPITIIVPFPAGAGADAVGRLLAEAMRASLGQPVVIENVSGAGGSIGVGRAARAANDGYTLVLGTWSTFLGQEIFPPDEQTPQALGTFHKAEIEKWWPILKAANIKGE